MGRLWQREDLFGLASKSGNRIVVFGSVWPSFKKSFLHSQLREPTSAITTPIQDASGTTFW